MDGLNDLNELQFFMAVQLRILIAETFSLAKNSTFDYPSSPSAADKSVLRSVATQLHPACQFGAGYGILSATADPPARRRLLT